MNVGEFLCQWMKVGRSGNRGKVLALYTLDSKTDKGYLLSRYSRSAKTWSKIETPMTPVEMSHEWFHLVPTDVAVSFQAGGSWKKAWGEGYFNILRFK
jgi:hypothetical protein